jgi:DNA-binding IclR family transcriptional regulator
MRRPDPERLQRVRSALARLCAERGGNPTINEIAIASKLRVSTLRRYLDHLIDLDEITHSPGRWRSIRLQKSRAENQSQS